MTNTDIDSKLDLALPQDPKEADRLEKAYVVYGEIAKGKSIGDAMATVGLSRQTYYDWLEAGVFTPIIAARVQGILAQIEAEVSEGWPEVVKGILNTAMGISDQEDGVVYPRDRLAAAKWLQEHVIAPAAQKAPDPAGAEQRYLEQLEGEDTERAQSSWAPGQTVVDLSALEEGDEVTIKKGKKAIDVTPKPKEKSEEG